MTTKIVDENVYETALVAGPVLPLLVPEAWRTYLRARREAGDTLRAEIEAAYEKHRVAQAQARNAFRKAALAEVKR